MIQSQINRNIRLDLADAILLSKAKKDLSFAEIADGTGLAEAFVTAALLGQQALPADAARLVGAKLDLDECIDSLEVRKKPGGHWIIRYLAGLDLVGLASL